jgi:hypothetical protein
MLELRGSDNQATDLENAVELRKRIPTALMDVEGKSSAQQTDAQGP